MTAQTDAVKAKAERIADETIAHFSSIGDQPEAQRAEIITTLQSALAMAIVKTSRASAPTPAEVGKRMGLLVANTYEYLRTAIPAFYTLEVIKDRDNG